MTTTIYDHPAAQRSLRMQMKESIEGLKEIKTEITNGVFTGQRYTNLSAQRTELRSHQLDLLTTLLEMQDAAVQDLQRELQTLRA